MKNFYFFLVFLANVRKLIIFLKILGFFFITKEKENMFLFDKKRRVKKINKFQSQVESVMEQQSSKKRLESANSENIFLKNQNYFPQNSQNLWNYKQRFSQKQLKLYHIPNDLSSQNCNEKMGRKMLRTKNQNFLRKKRELMEKKEEKQDLRQRRVMERTALQKMSKQFVVDSDKSALNQLKMLSRATTADLARTKSRPGSAVYLNKRGCIWNNYQNKNHKYVKNEFTKKVIEGEERAVKMINSRIEDQLVAQSLALSSKKKFRDERLGRLRNRSCLPGNEETSQEMKPILKKSESAKKFKIKGMKKSKSQICSLDNTPLLFETCKKFGNFHEILIRKGEKNKKRIAMKRIDYYEEFRNMPIRDVRVRSALVKDNSLVNELKNGSEFASNSDSKKGKIQRKNKNPKFFGRKTSRSDRRIDGKVRLMTSEDRFRRRKLYKSVPFKKKFMSQEAKRRSEIKPILKDRIENQDIIEPLNLKEVKFFLKKIFRVF